MLLPSMSGEGWVFGCWRWFVFVSVCVCCCAGWLAVGDDGGGPCLEPWAFVRSNHSSALAQILSVRCRYSRRPLPSFDRPCSGGEPVWLASLLTTFPQSNLHLFESGVWSLHDGRPLQKSSTLTSLGHSFAPTPTLLTRPPATA